MNLSECITTYASRFGNHKEALVCDDTGESWTYAQLDGEVNRIANALTHLGIRPGARVAVMLRSRPELILSSFAAFRVGGIYVSLNVRLQEEETAFILRDSATEVLIYDESVAEVVARVAPECSLKHCVCFGETPTEGTLTLRELACKMTDRFSLNPDIHDVAAIMYTGGTTGFPKGVVLTHEAIIGNSLAGSARFRITDKDIVLNAAPIFHIGGMAAGPFYSFLNGATLVLQERFDPERYVAAISKYGATRIWGVPSFYYTLLNKLPKEAAADFRSVELGWSGAGLFPAPVRKAFEERFGVPIYQYYGLTENSPGVTVEDPSDPERNYESVGTPLPGVEIKVVDQDDRTLPLGQCGELCVRSPYLMLGYWNNPAATELALRGGWLHTGDQGWIDKKGHFYIMGRKHDMIIVGGANVYPAEIERILLESDPRIDEVAVVGIPDDRLGEIPKAFVVLDEGVEATEEEIIELARARMAHYKAPRAVEFVDALPKTSIGKIDKKVLRVPPN